MLCQKLYLIRQKRFNEFSDLDDKLSQMTNHFCEGLYHYVHMSYLFNTENYHDLFKEIQLTKEITTKEHNKRQYYSASQYEAIYYSHIGDQKKEISLYEKMAEYYLEEKDSTNYGVIMHNIANMYLLQKKFKKAIPYYEKAITHYAISNSYFELAWCYYSIGQKEKCRHIIKQSKKATTILEIYKYLLEWLNKMIHEENSASCLNYLLNLVKSYHDRLTLLLMSGNLFTF